jgi:pyruvate dehydrogenase E1 component
MPGLDYFEPAFVREVVLEGGYRVDRRGEEGYEPEENIVNVFAMGAVVPEAIAASEELRAAGIMANVFAVTAAGRLYRSLATGRRALRAPVVTVADGHSHALAFIASALGGRAIPLGVDVFGESGTRADLYRKMAIDRDAIVRAVEAALPELDSDP